MSRLRDKIIRRVRTVAVILTGGIGVIGSSILIVSLLRLNIAKGESLDSLAATLIGCLLVSGIFIGLGCLAVFHVLSFWRSTSLKKALRLGEAMQILGAGTHKERLETIRHYSTRVYKTKIELPAEITENIQCKEVSTFLSPMFYNLDRLNAIGSPYYCCDFEQIQSILDGNKAKWGSTIVDIPGDTSMEVAALQRKIADLLEENKKTNLKFTAANGRESQLKKQLAEVENHMAVLVELAGKMGAEGKPSDKITKDAFKSKYLAIGKIYDITTVPVAYMEIFRKNMPKEKINWGGAPKQVTSGEQN